MANNDTPQIYLITPEQFSFDTFPNVLSRVLDVMD
ncbi:MAG: hypothetical protein ACI9AQ_001284, partial [Dinoroseobacter sp.]